MRFVIVGVGAIGGAIAGRFVEHDVEVVAVARGANFQKIATTGLTIESADTSVTVSLNTVASIAEVTFRPDDVVVIAVKSQDTLSVIRELSLRAPVALPIVCAQNGVENERVALRRFANVYAMCVICPSTYLQPGIIQLNAAPLSGVMDLGRWPFGVDDTAQEIAASFERSTFVSMVRTDIALLKWGKLMSNIHNSIEALCGTIPRDSELARRNKQEAARVLAAAGIDASEAEDAIGERFKLLRPQTVGGTRRAGGSSWQSLARGIGDIETDYLNGEIVLLGRLHSEPTPVSELLQRRANEMASLRQPPGSLSEAQLLAELEQVDVHSADLE